MLIDTLTAGVGLSVEKANQWLQAIQDTITFSNLNTNERLAAFLAQTSHESGGFTTLHENLNYSAEGLLRVFPTHFSKDEVDDFAHNQEKIANRVYADRMGNGDEGSGDGYRFRGRGLIQLTGRTNYTALTHSLGVDLLTNPDLLLQAEYAAKSAGWFWNDRNLNQYVDSNDFDGLTKHINGGLNGQSDRLALYNKILPTIC